MSLRNPSIVVLLLFLVILLFGAKRLPDAARSLGQSLRIFKTEVTTKDDDKGTNSGEKGPDSDESATK
jgi:sec-independent protein translocase protein TatA